MKLLQAWDSRPRGLLGGFGDETAGCLPLPHLSGRAPTVPTPTSFCLRHPQVSLRGPLSGPGCEPTMMGPQVFLRGQLGVLTQRWGPECALELYVCTPAQMSPGPTTDIQGNESVCFVRDGLQASVPLRGVVWEPPSQLCGRPHLAVQATTASLPAFSGQLHCSRGEATRRLTVRGQRLSPRNGSPAWPCLAACTVPIQGWFLTCGGRSSP